MVRPTPSCSQTVRNGKSVTAAMGASSTGSRIPVMGGGSTAVGRPGTEVSRMEVAPPSAAPGAEADPVPHEGPGEGRLARSERPGQQHAHAAGARAEDKAYKEGRAIRDVAAAQTDLKPEQLRELLAGLEQRTHGC